MKLLPEMQPSRPKPPATAGAFYFFSHIRKPANQPPIPGTFAISQAHLLFPSGQPMPALFREVLSLLELLRLQLAAEQSSAVGVCAIGEVLASDADTT